MPEDPTAGEDAAAPSGAVPTPERPRWQRVGIRVGIGLAAVVALFGLFLAVPYGAAAAVLKPFLNIVGAGPGLPADLDRPAERSVVLAADGSELATLSGEENRVVVTLDEVPETVRNAVLAAEDSDFFEHAGINHRALVRASWQNLRARRIVQGGSTVTQQLVKNAVLTADRTVDRKTTEMRYAIDLERRMGKEQILERYLNIAYFGEGVYGIATAAEFYFSKQLDELALDEAALLAGLISRPERANPAEDPDAAAARRDVVIGRMVEEGMISEAEADEARDAEVALDLSPLPPPENPFFVEYVKRILFDAEPIGRTRDERQRAVFAGGLRVHTTLDPRLQTAAEETIAEVIADPANDPLATLISVEPSSGAIRALAVGPKEYGPCEDDDEDCPTTQVNPAVPGLGGSGRQPGSAFKPILLAEALDEGVPPGWQEITDSETEVPGCDGYAPRNFDPSDGGDKDMAEAVEVSNNVYHAALIGHLQPEPVIEMAERLGVPDRDLPRECSLALGSATVFPLDMASAFATLANEGQRCETFAVARVERGDEVLLEHEPSCEDAIAPDLALLLTDLLRSPVESGTGTAAQLDRPVAGKTGTTDDFHDAWFVGYVPQLATAAWIGFEDPRPMEGILGVERVTGGTVPAQLWGAYMARAVEDLDVEEFGDPPPPEYLAVPDAIGRDVDEVADAIGEWDFHVLTEEVSDYRPAGEIVEQAPEAGTEVPRGHLLRLQVSDGTGDPPEVPDVVGLDEDEAREVLEDAEYDVEVVTEDREVTLGPDEDPADLDPADGEVVEQDPSGGTTLEPGERVRITVVRYDVEREEPAEPGDGDDGEEDQPSDDADVEISEVRPADDPDDEYVGLRVTGGGPADVGGWSIETDGGERLDIGDGYVVAPDVGLRVYSGGGPDRPDRYHNGLDEPVLDQDGGVLRLLDDAGNEVARVEY